MEQGRTLSRLGLFQHGIHYLAPGQQIRLFLTDVADKMDEIQQEGGKFDFTVSTQYVTAVGAKLQHDYSIDFRHLMGVIERGSPLQEVSQHLKKLADSISKIERGLGKLKVDVHTHEDRVREAARLKQLISEQRHDQSSSDKPPDNDPESNHTGTGA